MKKSDLPAMPFYFGDWRKAPEVRALPLDVRMIWFEMLGYMWESTERGYLTLNGNPIDVETLALMLGIEKERLTLALTLMDKYKVYSKRESDGALYCRKMVNDDEIRVKRAAGGVLGGNPKLTKSKKINKGYPSTQPSPEDEDVNISIGGMGEKTWRTDFQIYLKECNEGYKNFMENSELIKKHERLNPGVNVKLSIEKGYEVFWGIEKGWKHKKKSKSKTIDWQDTIINSISINKVYIQK